MKIGTSFAITALMSMAFFTVAPASTNTIICLSDVFSQIRLEARADALYWKACTEGLPYGFNFSQYLPTILGANEPLKQQPGYGWGFRLQGAIRDCFSNRFSELEWVHFDHTTSTTANKSEGWATLRTYGPSAQFTSFTFNPADSITVRDREQYDKVVLRVGQILCGGRFGSIQGFAGGGWSRINVKDRFSYVNSTVVAQQLNLNVSCGFVSLGFGFASCQRGGLGINGRVGIACCIGDVGNSFSGTTAFPGQPVRTASEIEPSQTHCFPLVEAKASLSFTRVCGCISVRGELGYEIDYYFDLPGTEFFTSIQNPTEAFNRGFGGLFFGLSVIW